jgi:hypothetical protein
MSKQRPGKEIKMRRKIDRLQEEIDRLLDLCNEACDLEEDVYVDLGVMILKSQDGVLEPHEFSRMEKWLFEDRQALRYYVDFQLLTAQLHEYFSKSWLARLVDSVKSRLVPGVV